MKRFRILVSETALKFLRQLELQLSNRIKEGLKELENDPFRPRPKADIKKLHGFEKPEMYRIRIGDFRAIYFVIGNEIKVTEIMRRGKDYEWLE